MGAFMLLVIGALPLVVPAKLLAEIKALKNMNNAMVVRAFMVDLNDLFLS
jgi:hypothetical protein